MGYIPQICFMNVLLCIQSILELYYNIIILNTVTVQSHMYAAPRLSGSCREGRSRLNIICQTTHDRHMTSLTFNCSYDNGPPELCMFSTKNLM